MERREKIKLVRSMLNMDYGEFPKEISYNAVSIHMAESGKRSATDELCKKICDAFDVREEWLMGDDGEEPTVENIFSKYYEVDGEAYPRKALVPEFQAKRVREVFEKTGLIQRDFCKETGWTLSNLQDMLNGRRKLSMRYAERIEVRYGIGTGWLLYGIEEEKNYPMDSEMIEFLKKNESARKVVKKMMDEAA